MTAVFYKKSDITKIIVPVLFQFIRNMEFKQICFIILYVAGD